MNKLKTLKLLLLLILCFRRQNEKNSNQYTDTLNDGYGSTTTEISTYNITATSFK